MALHTFRLPDPGEGLVEADIVTWRVAVGDQVKINDILVEVETSKSLVELPTPYAGTVTELLVNEGDTVDVGTPIISIDDGVDEASPAETNGGGEAQVPNLVGYGPRTGSAKRRPRRGAGDGPVETHDQVADTFSTHAPVSRRADDREPLQAEQDAPTGAPLPGPGETAPAPTPSGGAVLAKPPVRKLAKDLGVDLGSLVGSGPGGVITRDDVTAASKRVETAEEISTPVEARAAREDVRIPIKGVRKSTAEAMVRSAFTAPHVSVFLDCDVSATMRLVERLKARREFADLRVSPLLIAAKAVCLALGRTPELNSFWDEPAQHIVLKSSVNLGIAAATSERPHRSQHQGRRVAQPRRAGGCTPRGRDNGARGQGSARGHGRRHVHDHQHRRVRCRRGQPDSQSGESGILCIGQIARRPWVVGDGPDERIEPRWVTTLSVSFDHRLADGAQGSTFLPMSPQFSATLPSPSSSNFSVSAESDRRGALCR